MRPISETPLQGLRRHCSRDGVAEFGTVGNVSSARGGVAAAYGFRYQYLVTVEVLLELYEADDSDWAVGVDLASQD